MLAFAKDPPNICSIAGLSCAVLGIYYAIQGIFPAAMIGMIWAVLFDWLDGIIARKMKGRNEEYQAFGGQLDSLIDIVSFGICPAVVLLSYGKFNPWFLPGALLIVGTSAIRLSYFNVFGLVDDSTYMGLALDNNVIILTLFFLLDGFVSHAVFSVSLYTMLMVLAILNVAPVRTPKFSGRWFYALIVYTVVLTGAYGWKMMRAS
jgi:archaetidylserine synthase